MSDVKGIEIEVDRKSQNLKNKDIDYEKSGQNISLVSPKITLYQDTKNRVEELKATGSRVQKNSVVCAGFVFTLPESVPEKDMTLYFSVCVGWLANHFGKENLLQADIHLDETRPHMHVHLVPQNPETGKLQARTALNRDFLQNLHTNLPLFLALNGFEITKGSSKGKRYIEDIHEYKAAMKKVEEARSEAEKWQHKAEVAKETALELENKVVGKVLDITSLKEDEKRLKGNLERLRGAVDDLQRQKDNLSHEINEDITSLTEETSKIEKLLQSLQELLSKLFSNLRNVTVLRYSKNKERVQIQADIPTRLYQDILHQQKEITSLVNQTSARKESVLGKIKKHQETIRQEDQNIPLSKKEKNLGFER